jgi:hypothetical protein
MDKLEDESLFRPTCRAKQSVERCLGTLTMQLEAMEPIGEIEQVAVDLPALVFFVARPNERAVGLKDHAGKFFESRRGVFPRAIHRLDELRFGTIGGSERFRPSEHVDVKVVEGRHD